MIRQLFLLINTYSPFLYLTQSLWRDEAFAVQLSQRPLIDIIRTSAADFNPPLHYILLHIWMTIFGRSEIAIRGLSFIFYILLLYVVYRFSKLLVSGKKSSLFTLLVGLNPMLLYYAFEVRMYSMFAFFATLSTYALYNKRWRLYIIASILGLYTHSYMPFTLFVHVIYIIALEICNYRESKITIKKVFVRIRPFFLSGIAISLFYTPWIPVILSQWRRSKESWIYPIDIQLLTSSLGNIFTGYEGTPGGWWWATRILTLAIAVLTLFALKKRFWKSLLLTLWFILPLGIILAISAVKPIFVNRYVIFATVAEAMVVNIGLMSIPYKTLNRVFSGLLLILLVGINIIFPKKHKKMDIRSIYQQLNQNTNKDTIILADALVYFEGIYYYKSPSHVFLYYPSEHLPLFVGSAVIAKDKILKNIPKNHPVVFVNRDGTVENRNATTISS